jgi:PRC-barrel domain
MNRLAIATVISATLLGAAYAQETTIPLTTLPQNVTNYSKQIVYDQSNVRIGEINDAFVDKDGKVVAFIIGVGGFLGLGEKDVAVSFNSVHVTSKDGKPYLTMNTTKELLMNATGYRYDGATGTWVRT